MVVVPYLYATPVNTPLQGCTWVSGTGLDHSATHHEIFEATAELLAEFVLYKIILKLHLFVAACNNARIG